MRPCGAGSGTWSARYPTGGIVRAVMAARRTGTAVVLFVVFAAMSGCASDGTPAPNAADPGVAHVHGLGVDPADGTLYAATHYGLFRVPASGTAVRVAGRRQDTMGFTVAGPGDFLGSGHPDPAERLPARLGLIESTDRGATWTPLSLSGEVDFHALHVVGTTVYGWDSGTGRLMASSDRRTWRTLATLGLFDFAVNPSNPQELLATTQSGLGRSSDGGRTFTPAGPVLAYLSWPRKGDLWAVSADGALSHSADAGRTWQPRGTLPGQPQALAVVDDVIYAAVSDDGIYSSADGGRTFTLRYRYDQ